MIYCDSRKLSRSLLGAGRIPVLNFYRKQEIAQADIFQDWSAQGPVHPSLVVTGSVSKPKTEVQLARNPFLKKIHNQCYVKSENVFIHTLV